MDKGNWIPIDKNAVRELPMNRPYTALEAIFCLSVDIDNTIHKCIKAGKGSAEIPKTPNEAINLVMSRGQTISGYAALWGWSRCKVRTFINRIRQGLDTNQTGVRHPIRLIINNLRSSLDGNQTGVRQALDTTNYPISSNLNPEETKTHSKRSKKPPLTDQQFMEYLSSNAAYKHIDIEKERAKCEAWCQVNRHTFSRRRLIGWLNRVEKPIGGNNEKRYYGRGSATEVIRPSSAARHLGDGEAYPIDCEVTE